MSDIKTESEIKASKQQREIVNVSDDLLQIGTDTKVEVEEQGAMLNETERNLGKVAAEMKGLVEDIDAVGSENKCKACLKTLFLCFLCCRQKSVNKTKPVEETVDNHLAAEEIEKNWNRRYDPNELWLKQVEDNIDKLISIQEQMSKTLVSQTEKTKKMNEKTVENIASVKRGTDKVLKTLNLEKTGHKTKTSMEGDGF